MTGTVDQLGVSAGTLYAVTAACSRPDCTTATLLSGAVGGGRLTRVPGVPSFYRDGADLTATGSEVTLLIQPHGHYTRYDIWSDRAGSWRSHSTPCVGIHAAIANVPPRGVALACGVGAGAGNETKTIYASDDGARSWRRTASVGFTGGYVGSLATNGSSSWVLGESRGSLLVSHDGGRTWRDAIVAGASGVEGFTDVQFLNRRDAVAISSTFNGDLIALSYDGGAHWTTHVFQPVSGPQ